MNRSLLSACALALVATLPALAQTPDPRDPQGYFPLAAGNEWEYRVDLTRPASPGVPNTSRTEYLRYRITPAAGGAFTLVTTRYSATFAVVGQDAAVVRFDEATASVREVLAGDALGSPTPFFACDLGLPFDDHNPGETLCYRGATQGQASIPQLTGTSEPVTTKQFASFVYSFSAVHGLGFIGGGGGCEPCTNFSDRDDYTLTFAVVDGQTYGARVVAGEASPAPITAARFEAFPNPTTGPLTLRGASATEAEVYDTLGRRVRSVALSSGSEALLDLSGLPAGVYVVRAGSMTTRVVVR